MSFLELLRKRIIYYRFQAMVFGLLSFVFSIIYNTWLCYYI